MSDRVVQHVKIHRLSDDGVETCVERAVAVLRARMTGAGDCRRTPTPRFAAAHAPYQFVTVFDRHADI